MNILIDICHPAHVHLLKNVYRQLVKDGNDVTVTVKDLPAAIKLLEIYGIPYVYIGHKSDSIGKKGLMQLLYDFRLWKIALKKRIDVGVGTSVTIAHVSRLSKMKSIVIDDDDDEVEPLFVKYAHTFADSIMTPVGTHRKSPKTVFYSSYHAMAHLHPNYFKPDPSVLKEAGLTEGEKFFVMRFNAFKAHHDVGVVGLSIENKRRLVEMLSKQGRVFITTEKNIDDEFKPYQIKLSPEKVHSLMYYATMFVGDSQSMTSEAAILGTPAIRCNTFVGKLHTLNEIENDYGLTYGFLPQDSEKMFKKIEELLSMPDLKKVWMAKREKLLADKIDYAAFLTWFIENYPKSKEVMKNTPEYQYRFR